MCGANARGSQCLGFEPGDVGPICFPLKPPEGADVLLCCARSKADCSINVVTGQGGPDFSFPEST